MVNVYTYMLIFSRKGISFNREIFKSIIITLKRFVLLICQQRRGGKYDQ